MVPVLWMRKLVFTAAGCLASCQAARWRPAWNQNWSPALEGHVPCAGGHWVHWAGSGGDPADLHGASRLCSVVRVVRGGGRGHGPPLPSRKGCVRSVGTGKPGRKAGRELTWPGQAPGAAPRGLEVSGWCGGDRRLGVERWAWGTGSGVGGVTWS